MRYVSASLIAILLPITTCPTTAAELEQKAASVKGSIAADPATRFRALADVAEAEPNGSPALAQQVGCGNSFRPAELTNVAAVPDTDWISFTADAGQLITVETAEDGPGLPLDTVLNLFASDGMTSLASNDDSGGSLFSRIADFEAPYTSLYYARIRGFNVKEGSYRANVSCADPPPAPANDQCAGAIVIPSGDINLSGTTRFATNDYDLCPGQQVCPSSCAGFNSPGRDAVYRLDVTSAGQEITLAYDLDSPSTDASLYIVTDCAKVQATCVAGEDSELGTPGKTLSYVFPAAGTYYLILDAFTSGGAGWTLTGCLACTTPARIMSWGKLKTIYR